MTIPRAGSRLLVLATGVLVASATSPAGAWGQAPELELAEELLAAGDVGQAREMVLGWWGEHFDGAAPGERQRALWLRGRLTVDPSIARRDYLRLVIEHPGSPHSAAALLRLAQAEEGSGRIAAAADHLEQLLGRYPQSPERLEARRWLDAHAEEIRAARRAAAVEVPDAPPGARGAPVTTSVPDETATEAPDEPPAEAAAGPVSVQLGAFSSPDRARGLLRRAGELGIDGLRLVRVDGSDLVRVRAGRFSDRDSAGDLQGRVRSLGFDAVIVTDGERERSVP